MKPKIVWISTQATPQFAPLTNALSDEYEVFAWYFFRGSSGRGWGNVELSHPHGFLRNKGFFAFIEGLRVAGSRDVVALVILGYSRAFAWGALTAARVRGIGVLTAADSDGRHEIRRSALRRAAKKVFLRTLFDRNRVQVVAFSDSNELFWRHYGFQRILRAPFESPIPDSTYPIATRQPFALFVGRLIRVRAPLDAITAVGIARSSAPDLELVVVGSGTELDGLELPPWVRLMGSQAHDQLAEYYREASVLVVPSTRERYGLVVREALQFGLPVVATNGVPAAAALCDHVWNIVDVGDTEAMARAIVTALSSPRWEPMPPKDMNGVFQSAIAGLLQDRQGRDSQPPSRHLSAN